ncbi:MAG: phosphoribosylglycinamide formyltransferase [Bacteroidetes bacterium]|nr:phosphoribosylglycinamide formyltransferase [Bacteroidota bacterium]
MKKIAIFASGNGSNAERIARNFSDHPLARVALILTNKPDAFVLERARNLGIPSVVFNRGEFYNSRRITDLLKSEGIDFIVLAGFLWLVPDHLLDAFPNRIVNIHPALLPAYGGKGMYGDKVHEAVLKSGDMFSGITIHYVNGIYDNGEIIFQEKVKVMPEETIDSLASKIHELEYRHYPEVIEKLLGKLT